MLTACHPSSRDFKNFTRIKPSRVFLNSYVPTRGKDSEMRAPSPTQTKNSALQPLFTFRHLLSVLPKAWNNSTLRLEYISFVCQTIVVEIFFVSIAFILSFPLLSSLIDINRSILRAGRHQGTTGENNKSSWNDLLRGVWCRYDSVTVAQIAFFLYLISKQRSCHFFFFTFKRER